jgi:hypothetical protein
MNLLPAELHRLFSPVAWPQAASPADTNGAEWNWVDPAGRVRALVVELARPADWTALATLWSGVQDDLAWPAPAIAVSGVDAYQLWFSLAEPVPAAQARALLEALCRRYWSHLAPDRVRVWPQRGGTGAWVHAAAVPAEQKLTGHWSAFVAPGLAAMLADEPWLDGPPNPDAQADLLARLKPVTSDELRSVETRLGGPLPESNPGGTEMTKPPAQVSASLLPQAADPKVFLRRVMNDSSVDMHLRIEAAKALLPYS